MTSMLVHQRSGQSVPRTAGLQVLLPLVTVMAKLHKEGIAHHHVSPDNVFWMHQEAGQLYMSLPCPSAWPQEVNDILPYDVNPAFIPPEVWVRASPLTPQLQAWQACSCAASGAQL